MSESKKQAEAEWLRRAADLEEEAGGFPSETGVILNAVRGPKPVAHGSTRQFELLLPMGGLFGVSIYHKASVGMENGYRDEPIDPYSLPWEWWVNNRTHECVRMTRLGGPVRILASPIGDGAAAYDVPGGMVLVHDLGCIWVMGPMDFQTQYISVELLVQAMPQGNAGVCVISPPGGGP
jgi:hypothetical protein